MRLGKYILRGAALLAGCIAPLAVPAQAVWPSLNGYEPYRAEEADDPLPEIVTDTALFYRAVQQYDDLYARQTAYRLSFLPNRRRGVASGFSPVTCHGIPVSGRYASALRLLQNEERTTAGLKMAFGTIGHAGGISDFRFPEGDPVAATRLALLLSDRNYRVGVRGFDVRPLPHGWSLTTALDARTGRDLWVEGVFTNALTAALRLARNSEAGHCSVTAVVPVAMRGLQGSSTAEAFALTGDPCYNPSWGWQNGKVRNARIRRTLLPMLLAETERRISPATRLAAGAVVEAGTLSLSGLEWFDAPTPLPDNYRYMPSYAGDEETAAAWRNGDPRYTQIDWAELYARNRMAGGEAAYAVTDRVERRTALRAQARFTTEIDDRLTLHYGLRGEYLRTRYYKKVRDLLGAASLLDTDYYLIDDDSYGNLLQNNLRDPDRRVGVGDRFGYDYALTQYEAGATVQTTYRADRFRLDIGAELTEHSLRRRGYYEKELFPGGASFGPSRRLNFTTYTLKLAGGYAFSPGSYIEATVMAAAVAPDAEDLFLQPEYNNRTVADPELRRLASAELLYTRTAFGLELQLAAFINHSERETATRRYYDDLASAYADLEVSGIRMRGMGLEAAAEIRITARLGLSLAASVGDYRYTGDPLVRVYADADNRIIDAGSRSAMGGCRQGGVPRRSGICGVHYFGRRGWGFRVTANYAGGRYVEPSLLRRTPRVARQASTSPERFAEFVSQERLGDAATLDASLFKTFMWGGRRLTCALSANNLLNDRRIVAGGWESLRVRRLRQGDAYDFKPFDSRYTYAAPRSLYLSVSYKF